MQLATFALQLGDSDRTYVLRPTLRAAFHLHRKYGFAALYEAVREGSFTAIMDLITATSADVPIASMQSVLDAREQLLEFVLILSGARTSSTDKPVSGRPMPFDEYFAQLFQIGTGWLGWAPADVWDATISEILNAQQGRMAMLKAIFGSGRDDQEEGGLDSVRDKLNAIGDLNVHSLGAM
ncbi:hypothetical protein [Bradyrhizobium sp. Gha]|uniref:hypothetical protein n=1 Tax=Bradyrhizobium sp. Gha TaxID=1855318 RepID=UPI0008E24907|nr:hypothetical protein [Bradyrhizobium sp. Gha]SFK04582.1 hypothetical protein SAMN05216525_14968 [Bradyrhizobium sp. Gha]